MFIQLLRTKRWQKYTKTISKKHNQYIKKHKKKRKTKLFKVKKTKMEILISHLRHKSNYIKINKVNCFLK